jgi:hypothetical protein
LWGDESPDVWNLVVKYTRIFWRWDIPPACRRNNSELGEIGREMRLVIRAGTSIRDLTVKQVIRFKGRVSSGVGGTPLLKQGRPAMVAKKQVPGWPI